VTPPENLLRRLARINPTTAFFVALVVMVAGLFLPGIVGAALLFVLFAGLAALTFTTWPVQTTSSRTARVILLALLLSAIAFKII
jgi:prepilin signal peptidase PulO-like enzyme (type II secretory pathway)